MPSSVIPSEVEGPLLPTRSFNDKTWAASQGVRASPFPETRYAGVADKNRAGFAG
jgi:hypothetical protein